MTAEQEKELQEKVVAKLSDATLMNEFDETSRQR